MRLNLAQALMCPSDLLLLDEPTNHLDLDAIIWLEDWLKRYPGTLLIISHDRDFLDEVVNVVVHIDERKLRRYSGNYSSFERQRAAQLVLAQGMMEKQMRQRAHLQSFIDRFKAQASKARQAQSRIKALARMEEVAPLRAAAEFSFEFREPLRAPNLLLTMDAVSAGYRNIDEDTQTVSEDHRVRHQFLAAGRTAHRPVGHQRRRQVDLHQDHRRRAAIAGGRPSSTRACPSATSPSTRSRCCATMNRRCGT